MPHYCSVSGCNNSTIKNEQCSFFRIPANPKTREEWMQFAEVDKSVCPDLRICSFHFEEKCFKKYFPRPLLHRGVVPTIKDAGNKCTKKKTSEEGTSEEKSTDSNEGETVPSGASIILPAQAGNNLSESCSEVKLECKKVRKLIISDVGDQLSNFQENTANSTHTPISSPIMFIGTPPSAICRLSSQQHHNKTTQHRAEYAGGGARNLLPLFCTSSPRTPSRQNRNEDTEATFVSTPSGRIQVTAFSTPSRQVPVSEIFNTPSGRGEVTEVLSTPSRKGHVTQLSENHPNTTGKGRVRMFTLPHESSGEPSTIETASTQTLSPKTLRLNSYKRTIALLRSRVNRLKCTKNSRVPHKRATKKKLQELIEGTKAYLPKQAQLLFESQLRLSNCKKSGRRYSDELKDLCLSIFYLSPKTYSFLRRICAIPSERTLREYQSKFPISPGLNQTILSELKTQFEKQPIEYKVVNLLVDEIHLTPEIHYDASANKFVGFADDGKTREAVEATAALVATITWINKKAKQPIGYWFLGKKGNSDKTHDIILSTIDEIFEKTGLIVKSVICDQGPRNQGLVKKLNITPETPYFVMHDTKIYLIFDPPHLLKSLRNNLLTKNLFYNGGLVNWAELRTVFDLNQQTLLNLLPKLRERHFDLGTFSKMKVSLVAQVLSESMFTAYSVFKFFLPQHFDVLYDMTSQFVLDVDRTFDSVNSSLLRQPASKKMRYAISEGSEHIAFLQDMAQKFQNARFIAEKEGGKEQPPCLKGFVLTINAILQLAEELRQNYNIPLLPTRRFNQDALENLFAAARQKNGCSQNPSPMQFENSMRHLLITHLGKLSKLTNCEDDNNEMIVRLSQIKEIPLRAPADIPEIEIVIPEPTETELTDAQEFTQSNAIYYCSGYVAKLFLSHHKCEECRSLLNEAGGSANYKDHQVFTLLKCYDNTKGLTFVKESVYLALTAWETKYREIIDSLCASNNVSQILANIFENLCPPIPLCSSESTVTFLRTYLRVRCHWEARFRRRKLEIHKRKDNVESSSMNPNANKMKKFKGKGN